MILIAKVSEFPTFTGPVFKRDFFGGVFFHDIPIFHRAKTLRFCWGNLARVLLFRSKHYGEEYDVGLTCFLWMVGG